MKKSLWCLALLLAACNRDQPPAPAAEQADQLNEAEDMLNDMAKTERAAPEDTAPPSNPG